MLRKFRYNVKNLAWGITFDKYLFGVRDFDIVHFAPHASPHRAFARTGQT